MLEAPILALVPTDHQTFDDCAPLTRITEEREPVVKVVTT